MRAPRLRRRKDRPRLRRGIYILPSLFTVANIFCGFLSIVESSRGLFEPNQGHFERSALLILASIVADILDGRIARLTNASTSFGEVYDSLADVISFGVAPAMLAFHWGLWQIPRYGWVPAFLFLVAGSIRLARFSSRHHDTHSFDGLPIPAGAGSVAMLVLVSPEPVQHPAFVPVVAFFLICLSLLMVSNLPYRSFKDLNLRKQWPAPTLFLIALGFSLITLTPHVLAVFAAVYVLSAPVAVLTHRVRRRGRSTQKPETTERVGDGDEHPEAVHR